MEHFHWFGEMVDPSKALRAGCSIAMFWKDHCQFRFELLWNHFFLMFSFIYLSLVRPESKTGDDTETWSGQVWNKKKGQRQALVLSRTHFFSLLLYFPLSIDSYFHFYISSLSFLPSLSLFQSVGAHSILFHSIRVHQCNSSLLARPPNPHHPRFEHSSAPRWLDLTWLDCCHAIIMHASYYSNSRWDNNPGFRGLPRHQANFLPFQDLKETPRDSRPGSAHQVYSLPFWVIEFWLNSGWISAPSFGLFFFLPRLDLFSFLVQLLLTS